MLSTTSFYPWLERLRVLRFVYRSLRNLVGSMITGSVLLKRSEFPNSLGVFSRVMQQTKAILGTLAIIVFLVLHPE